jgi:hypothetical protein
MYVCMHACMHVCLYIYMFIHVCVCMYIYIYACFLGVPILAEVHIERGSTSSRGTCRLSSTSCASSLIVPEQRIIMVQSHPQRSERSRFCRFNMVEWYLIDVYSLNLAFKGVTHLVLTSLHQKRTEKHQVASSWWKFRNVEMGVAVLLRPNTFGGTPVS